ncbi:MAG: hypothetical protein RR313_00075 [Anaerovoracaceae bacterium]
MNSIKQLASVYAKVKKSLKTTDIEDKAAVAKLKAQEKLLDEILEYYKSFKWLKQQETIDRVKFFTKSFDYELYCKKYDVTYEAAKTAMNYASNQFKLKIGEYTLSLIDKGSITEAQMLFYFRSGKVKLSSYLLSPVVENLPPREFHTIDLADCLTELKYLARYSTAGFIAWQNRVDPQKLSYLRHVLEGDSPKATLQSLRIGLLKVLLGKMSAQDLIDEQKDINPL